MRIHTNFSGQHFEEIAKSSEKDFEETAIPAIFALSESIIMEPERIFKRKIYNRLLQWKESSNGKSALLIEGARRVGKSTIVDAFARNEVKSSSYKTHTSMDEFCKKFSSRITNDRYLIYAKDYAHKESVRYIPAYLTLFL